jgi:hypothetical protein
MDENQMSDQELEEYEQAKKVVEDRLDRLENLRKSLCNSRVEATWGIKRGTSLGALCPYYLKSRRLLEEQELPALLAEMRSLLAEFE